MHSGLRVHNTKFHNHTYINDVFEGKHIILLRLYHLVHKEDHLPVTRMILGFWVDRYFDGLARFKAHGTADVSIGI